MPKQDIPGGRWAQARRFFDIGLLAILGTGFVIRVARTVALILSAEGAEHFPLLHLSLGPMVAVMAVIIDWIWAAPAETEILQRHFREFIPPLPSTGIYGAVALAAVLGALIFLSDKIVTFCAVFACFGLLDIWGTRMVTVRIRRIIDQAHATAAAGDARQGAWEVVEAYYFGRPHLARRLATLFSPWSRWVSLCLPEKHCCTQPTRS